MISYAGPMWAAGRSGMVGTSRRCHALPLSRGLSMRHATYGLALTASLLLTACGGGSSGSSTTPLTSSTPGSQSGTTSQSQSESAISATNALGEPMKSLTSYNNSSSPQSVARGTESLKLNTCQTYSGGGSFRVLLTRQEQRSELHRVGVLLRQRLRQPSPRHRPIDDVDRIMVGERHGVDQDLRAQQHDSQRDPYRQHRPDERQLRPIRLPDCRRAASTASRPAGWPSPARTRSTPTSSS